VDQSDTEQGEQKYVFRRRLRVKLKGKKEFSVEDYGSIEKDYKEFKKKYLLKADSIVSILLIFMMKKCDQEAMITKTLEKFDRVDGGRGMLLLLFPLYQSC